MKFRSHLETALLASLTVIFSIFLSSEFSAEPTPEQNTKGAVVAKVSPLDYKADKDGIIHMTRSDGPISSTIDRSVQNRNVVILAAGNLPKEDKNSALYRAFQVKKQYEGVSKYGDKIAVEIIHAKGKEELLLIAVAGSVLSVDDPKHKKSKNGALALRNVDEAAKNIPARFRVVMEHNEEQAKKKRDSK